MQIDWGKKTDVEGVQGAQLCPVGLAYLLVPLPSAGASLTAVVSALSHLIHSACK